MCTSLLGFCANTTIAKRILLITLVTVVAGFITVPTARALPVEPWGDWWPLPGPPVVPPLVPPRPPQPPMPWWEYATRLYQNDPFWAAVKLDNCNKTLASDGCTLTCFAMAVNTELMYGNYRNPNGPSVYYTPDMLNDLLKNYREQWADGTTRDGFQSKINPDGTVTPTTDGQFDAYILFDVVAKSVKQKTGRTFKMKTFEGKDYPTGLTLTPDNDQAIRDALRDNKSVIVRINDNSHSVLLLRINDLGDYEIWDPFSKTPTELYKDGFLRDEYLEQWQNPSTINEIWHYDIINFIPEPSSLFLLGLGVLFMRRRRSEHK